MQRLTERKHFRWGLTALIVIFISILLVVIFTNLPGFFDVLRAVGRILSPLFIGILIAFLLNPIVKLIDRWLLPKLQKGKRKPESAAKLSRVIGVLVAVIIAVLVVWAFFAMLLPQLYDSVMSIAAQAPTYWEKAQVWISEVMKDQPEVEFYLTLALEKVEDYVETWFQTSFVNDVSKLLSTLTTSVFAVVKGVTNFVIGLVASIYILLSKDLYQAQLKKTIVAVLPKAKANYVLRIGRESSRIFNGFLIGKIVDSAIIGVLCYIGTAIMRLPYAALLSTIVGVTNVIPVFGPVIGMIPGVLILLLIKPIQALYFLVFVIVLQQIDGNVIGPKILGDSIGISGFWVLVSITVAGSLFGVMGMLLGVPVFALIYLLISDAIDGALARKKLPVETTNYYDLESVDALQPLPVPEENSDVSEESADSEQPVS